MSRLRASASASRQTPSFAVALALLFTLVTLCTGAVVAFALSVVGGVR